MRYSELVFFLSLLVQAQWGAIAEDRSGPLGLSAQSPNIHSSATEIGEPLSPFPAMFRSSEDSYRELLIHRDLKSRSIDPDEIPQAESLMKSINAICEKQLGPSHSEYEKMQACSDWWNVSCLPHFTMKSRAIQDRLLQLHSFMNKNMSADNRSQVLSRDYLVITESLSNAIRRSLSDPADVALAKSAIDEVCLPVNLVQPIPRTVLAEIQRDIPFFAGSFMPFIMARKSDHNLRETLRWYIWHALFMRSTTTAEQKAIDDQIVEWRDGVASEIRELFGDGKRARDYSDMFLKWSLSMSRNRFIPYFKTRKTGDEIQRSQRRFRKDMASLRSSWEEKLKRIPSMTDTSMIASMEEHYYDTIFSLSYIDFIGRGAPGVDGYMPPGVWIRNAGGYMTKEYVFIYLMSTIDGNMSMPGANLDGNRIGG